MSIRSGMGDFEYMYICENNSAAHGNTEDSHVQNVGKEGICSVIPFIYRSMRVVAIVLPLGEGVQ